MIQTSNEADLDLERIAEALERIAIALERQAESVVSRLAPEGLSKQDAADFLGIELGTLEHLIRCRRLAYVQLGSQRGRIIPVESLRQLLQGCRQPTGEECRRNGKRLQPPVIRRESLDESKR